MGHGVCSEAIQSRNSIECFHLKLDEKLYKSTNSLIYITEQN